MTSSALPEKIAIVGMGCILPDANNPDEFWQNVLAKKISIKHADKSTFDTDAHFRPEMFGKEDKQDKSYTDLTADVEKIDFDGRRFRIPPAVANHMDDNQKIALLSAEQALAGISLDHVDRERISVFMGNSLIGEKHHQFQRRVNFDKFEHYLSKNSTWQSRIPETEREAVMQQLRSTFLIDTHSITEDSAPGVLPNIIAARIASVFDLHGHTYILDTACASGLAAIICGVQHLLSGESDVVICGAADMINGEIGRIYFSGINALSPDGSYPFDERANGFVIGQGGGAFVLKRMSDALRDKDPILAVIAGYGQTSDGKGKAIAAPNSVWQAKTIRRAIEMAGFPADTVELIEAHGTATKVGDASEIEALKTSFSGMGASRKNYCAVGSAKSNIGHLKSAAGIPSMIKTIQALRHKTLPPSANCNKVSSKLGIEDSPFYVNTEARTWEEKPHPRRAGVSAFGFGGANYHIALEEYRPNDYVGYSAPNRSVAETRQVQEASSATEPSSNLVLFSGSSRDEIITQSQAFSASLQDNSRQIQDLALEQSYRADASQPCRLALVFENRAILGSKLSLWQNATDPQAIKLLRTKGIYFCDAPARSLDQTAFLFPGQGSQYADMLLDLIQNFPSTRRIASLIDSWWKTKNGTSVGDLISSRHRGKDATEALLKDTRNTHPALLYSNLVAASLLQDMGIRPAWMIGHSAGEVVALAAAGKLSLPEATRLMDERSKAFIEMHVDDFGKMAAVRTDRNRLESIIAQSGLPVAIANINSPDQLIVSGSTLTIESFYKVLDQHGVKRIELNVSHAFHSPVVVQAAEQFGKAIADAHFTPGHAQVMVNETCVPYPDDNAEIRAILKSQVTASVNFCGGIEELYRRGVRLFIEAGPNSVLGNLTQAILKDRDVTVVSVNFRNADNLESLNKALAAIFAEGIALQLIPAASVFQPLAAPNQNLAPVPAVSAPIATDCLESTTPQSSGPQRIVYSGVSVGLPGSYKKSFQDDNFDQLFAGHNFIERLSDLEKGRLAELRVTKVEKTEQGPAFRVLELLEEVIQLAGHIGKIDPLADYSLDPKETAHINNAVLHAVAAGYEALRDAQIPLVREYAKTASGKILPDNWVLPQSMQKRTGVIFAHGFPMVETVIAEVSRHVGFKFGNKLRTELIEFYETLVRQIRDPEAKKLLTNWFALNHHRLSQKPGGDEVYSFNHQFIQQISSLANNRLASYIHALGPNFQINAACSSTCTAVTLAEDMIRADRADRFIVIGADDPTSEASLPYLGAGFLSTGAASCEPDLYKAALPFDLRRNGMIMSSGAIGIVVERADLAQERGVKAVCELLGTHVFNTAGHHARLDVPRYAEELDEFLSRIERTHAIARSKIAPKLLYLSHETYTPARGGCSESEAVALRHAFGDRYTQIEVTNTKGMTGHTMGASIEDVVAARALETGRTPPVVNHEIVDPTLAGLKLSKGGTHSCEFALRMAAGFGSQGNYILLRKIPGSSGRISDPARHRQWLSSISGQPDPETELQGRLLRVKDKTPGALMVKRPLAGAASAPESSKPNQPQPTATATISVVPTQDRKIVPDAKPQAPGNNRTSIQKTVLEVVSEVTGYPPEMLELDMEIEADLGVDTVKQATILATLGERLGFDAEGGFQISAYPTIGHIVGLFSGNELASNQTKEVATAILPTENVKTAALSHPSTSSLSVEKIVLHAVSEITGYPPEMLELDMEIEADLGVDTVKQATILATLGERLGHDAGGEFQISAYPTIGHIVRLFAGRQPEPQARVEPVRQVVLAQGAAPVQAVASTESTQQIVLQVVSEITGYPPEMLELDMEIEADLGVDTVKQATILATLGERLGHDAGGQFQISAYPTIGHIVRLFSTEKNLASNQAVQPEAPAAPIIAPVASPGLIRQILRLEDEPLGKLATELSNSTILLWGEQPQSLTEIAQIMAPSCRQVRTLLLPMDGDPREALRTFVDLDEFSADIWIDLGNWGSTSELFDQDLAIAQQKLSQAAECRYAIFKRIQESSTQKPRHILSLSRSSIDPLGGFLQGLHQSLAKEWGRTCLLLEADGIATEQELARTIIAELSHESQAARISYRNGLRQAYKVIDAPLGAATSPLSLCENDTVLVTGGGNGIASQVLVAMAKQFACRYLIVGRTNLGEVDYSAEIWDDSKLAERKEELKNVLGRSGKRVTPVVLDKEFAQQLKQREIARTLGAVRALGREIHYLSADITDFHGFQSALTKSVSQTGPVTAVVHSAGLDISHFLDKKSIEEFSLVHHIKTIGTLHLAKLCPPESLKLFAAFTSISGVFGNPAQLDYSAGNSFLDASVRFLSSRFPNLHAVSMAWSGWSELGMAWRNAYVRDNAESMGLHLIPPALGTQAAVRELQTRSDASPVVLHRGLGEMLDARWKPCALGPLPLIDRIDSDEAGHKLAYHRFAIEQDEFLNQHRLNKVPLMPGVGFMEFMAEFHSRLEPAENAVRFRNISFHDAFKLYRDQARDAFIQAKPSGVSGEWEMRIFSRFTAKVGEKTELRDYSFAKVSSGEFTPPAWSPNDWNLEGASQVAYGQVLSHLDAIPQNVVFGPLFHDSRRIGGTEPDVVVSWNMQGLHTPYRLPLAQLDNPLYPLNRFRLNPCLLDSIHQAGVIHTILKTGHVHLPYGADEFVVVGKQDAAGTYQVHAKLVEQSTDKLVYDISLLDENGKICAWVKRSAYHRINS